MSKQEIAALSVRILSLYIIVNAVVTSGLETIPYLQMQWYATVQGGNSLMDLGSIPNLYMREITGLVFPLLVAVLLWLYANKLGARMVKDMKQYVSKQAISAVEIQTIIISIIGLFVAISSIPQFVLFFVSLASPAIPNVNFTAVLIQLVTPLLSLLMGWILLANASTISHFLQKERAKN